MRLVTNKLNKTKVNPIYNERGGGGSILSMGTLNLNINFYNICVNAMKLGNFSFGTISEPHLVKVYLTEFFH